MKPILSDNYYVNFQKDAYSKLNKYILNSKVSTLFILVDENTKIHCLPILLQELSTKKSIQIIEIEAGEIFKNIDTCTLVWNILIKQHADRESLLLNLGGGVITDLGGFGASTFKRGINFINIPTTLLSMVDASVGGKTGVDLGVLKNQIGMFSNPKMVVIDTRYLKTVSTREIRSGLAEIIKYSLTFDKELWNELKELNILKINMLNTLIYRSIVIKNEVVLKDPKEKGIRKVLNFGHTLGHAIESFFLASKNKENLTHGEAIAVGIITETYISNKLLNFPSEKLKLIKQTILSIYNKIAIDTSDYNGIIELLIHDKKNVNGQVNFVLLTNYEEFKLNCIVKTDLIMDALNYYKE